MRNIFFLFLIFLLTNCKQEKVSVSKFEFYPPFSDSTVNKNNFIEWRIRNARLFNLPILFSGVNDSIVIRFWPWEAFEFWSNMFEFRLDSNGWKGYHYCSYTFPNQNGRIFHVYGHENLGDSVFVVKQFIPKCGWDKFYDSLIFFQLRNLPTQALIKNFKYRGIMDGDGVEFEIATKNSYRWIGYNNPSSYSNKECQQIEEVVNMFRRQFGDDYYWPKITVKKVNIIDTKNPLHF